MKILLTGAHGFLGWHTRVRLRALTDHDVVLVKGSHGIRMDRIVTALEIPS